MIWWLLFYRFFIIGLFTIGGGYAMLPLIQRTVVTDYAWISAKEFTDIVAISQMTPGPIGINSATYIGYTVIRDAGYGSFLSVLGSFTATFAVVLPSFLIVLWLCRIYSRFNHSIVFTSLMSTLKPAVAGLVGAAAVIMITKENFPDWRSWIIFVIAFPVTMFTKFSPILLLILCGIAGYLIY